MDLSTIHCALNRPSPEEVEADDRAGAMVLTGEGTAFSAGMDIKEYFRGMKDAPRILNKVRRLNWKWQWRWLRCFEKPTIAMVNGWCFGGAFLPVVSFCPLYAQPIQGLRVVYPVGGFILSEPTTKEVST